MIRIADLRYRALAIDSLTFGPGITSVIGPNGSGKTSLIRLCTGIVLPEAGSILIDGTLPRQNTVGWVSEFPDRNFLFTTVSDEVASALRFRHLPPGEIDRRSAELLGQFGLAQAAHRQVGELSRGEKVLVALAAALAAAPRALLLDECDSHLDARSAARIEEVVRKSGVPYIIRSTQDMEAATGSDQVVFLEKGKIRSSGMPGTVFSGLEGTPFYPMTWRCRS